MGPSFRIIEAAEKHELDGPIVRNLGMGGDCRIIPVNKESLRWTEDQFVAFDDGK